MKLTPQQQRSINREIDKMLANISKLTEEYRQEFGEHLPLNLQEASAELFILGEQAKDGTADYKAFVKKGMEVATMFMMSALDD